MAQLGLIQADADGDIIRVAWFPHEYAIYKDAPDAVVTVVVALEPNQDELRDIAENSRLYKIVGGVVKKGNVPVVFDPGDDRHAAGRSLHEVSAAQEQTMLAGARAVIEKSSTPGATNVEKAIGWIAMQLMRLEDG